MIDLPRQMSGSSSIEPRSRILARAWILSALAACTSPSRPDPPPPAPPASASAVAEPLCPPKEARCAGESETETCSERGDGWQRARCGEAQLCLAGRCVPLSRPGEAPMDKARLLAVRGEGWLNVWTVSAPIAAKTVQKFQESPADVTAGGANRSWKILCSADGFVSVMNRPGERQRPPAFALLSTILVADRERPVTFKAGVTGGLRLWVNGALISGVLRAGARAQPDETLADAVLREGPNTITVVLEQTEEGPPGFWLRVHDEQNRVPPDLMIAPGLDVVPCSPIELVRLEPVVTPVAGGFDVALSPRFLGAAPRGAGALEAQVDLRREGIKAPLRALARRSLPLADLTARGAELRVEVRPPSAGMHEVALYFGPAPGAKRLAVAYAGELHERIVRLAAEAGSIGRRAGIPEGSLASYEYHVGRLVRVLAENEPDRAWLRRMTEDAESLGAALAAGQDPYATKTGYVYRAYRSRLDGQLQPYVIHVPRSYKPDGKPLPLILAMHGQNRLPEHGLRTVIGHAPDDTMTLAWAAHNLPALGDLGVIVAAPWGYGNAGPRPLGEDDALRVVEEMKQSYRVDPLRTSITGYSLGGTASFVIPLRSPDVFSAAAPLCGYPNLLGYESVRNVPHIAWEDALLAKRYIVNYAENGLHLPLHIVHGGLDGPGRSQVVADRYRDLGYTRVFDVQDQLDHNVWDYAYEDAKMLAWLRARRRPEMPERVRLTTGDYRVDRSYWVRLYAMREGDKLCDIDATWAKKDDELRVATSNVASFGLDVRALGLPPSARLVIDGATLPLPPDAEIVYAEREAGSWRVGTTEPNRAGRKRRGVSGPLDDIARHRTLVVYGTAVPANAETNRMVGEYFATFDPYGGGWAKGSPPAGLRLPLKADADVADAELTGQSLILIGGPSENKITGALAAGLPVRFEPDAVVVRGARHAGPDVGVSFIAPNPRDPEEYVVVHAGVTYRGTLASRNLPALAPDFLVYDARLVPGRGELLLGARAVRAGGFFGDDWR